MKTYLYKDTGSYSYDPTYHGKIMDLGYSLGYFHDVAPTREELNGICQGFTRKWCEACLLHEDEVFEQRVQQILSSPPTLEEVESIKEKIKDAGRAYSPENLTQKEKDTLDILALFENIAIFQEPALHTDLFGKPLEQWNVEQISEFASSDNIAEQGGLTNVRTELGIYNVRTYSAFLGEVEKACITSCDKGDIIAINLANEKHAIGLTYTVGEGWCFMDINQFPPTRIGIFPGDKFMLAKYIGSSLADSAFFTEQLIVTNVILPMNHEKRQQLSTELEEVSNTLAQQPITEKDTFILLNFAILLNEVELCNKLAKVPTVLDKDGLTAIFMAAQVNHTQVLKILLENMPVYNPIPFNSTVGEVKAVFLQNKYDDEAMSRLNAFIEKKIGQNTVENSTKISILPEEIATILGHYECVKLLRAKQNQNSEQFPSALILAETSRARPLINVNDIETISNKHRADRSTEEMQMSKAERSACYQSYRARASNIRDEEKTENKMDLIEEKVKPHLSPSKKLNSELIELILDLRISRNIGARRIQTELMRLHNCSLSLANIHKALTSNQTQPIKKLKRKKKFKRYSRPIPGDRIQMDTCKIAPGIYQYTAVDDCSRWRVLEIYKRRTATNTLHFLDLVLEQFPFPIQRIQTDRGLEFFAEKVQ